MANVGFATLQVIPSLKGAEAALASGLSGITSQASGAGTAAGAGFASKFSGGLVAGGLIVGAAAVVGKALFDLGAEFDAAYDRIRTGTGATGKELDKLEGSFRKVVTAVPTSFGSASTAVADLHSRLGLMGPQLEARAEQFLELSRITKTDVAENIRDVTRLFGDWSVVADQQGPTLDRLFRASQVTGVGINELAQQVVFFGSPLRQLGFSLDESVALLAKWGKEGVNVETVLGGMRQSMARLADPTDQVLGKLAEFPGLMERFVVAPNIAERFTIIKDKILELFRAGDDKSKLDAAALALQVFGRRAGADIVAAFGEGRFAVKDLMDLIEHGGDTVRKAGKDTDDFAEKWQTFKNKLKVAIEPVASGLFDAVNSGMTWAINNAEVAIPLLGFLAVIVGATLVAAFLGLAVAAWAAAIPIIVVAAPIIALGVAVAALVAGAILLGIYWDQVWNTIANNPAILLVLLPLGMILIPIIALVGLIKLLGDNWAAIWGWIKGAADDAWHFLEPILGFIHDRLDDLNDVLSWLGGAAWSAFIAVKDAAQWVWDNAQGPLNLVLGLLNTILGVWHEIETFLGDLFGGGGSSGSPNLGGGMGQGGVGHAAAGGSVWPGWLLVGEKGPELLRLGSSGYVYPNGQGPGGAMQAMPVAVAPAPLIYSPIYHVNGNGDDFLDGKFRGSLEDHDRELSMTLRRQHGG